MKSITKESLYWFLANFILLIALLYPAIENGFPLLYAESGTFISTKSDGSYAVDILNTYGLFVRHSSLSWNLWMLLFAQTLIVIVVLKSFLKFLLNDKLNPVSFGLIGFFLVFFTSIDSMCSSISPMIFEPLSLILFGLILFSKRLPKLALVVFIIFTAFNHSSMLIAIILSVCFAIYYIIKSGNNPLFKRSLLLLSISISLPILIAFGNYIKEGNFQISRNLGVQLIANFSENHMLEDFLNEKCKKQKNDLNLSLNYCENEKYRKHFSREDFMYKKSSPLYSHYPDLNWAESWEKLNQPYEELAFRMINDSKYGRKYLLGTLSSFLKQLQYVQDSKLAKQNFRKIISFKYRYNLEEYRHSAQFKRAIEYRNNELIESLLYVIFLLSFPIFLYIKRDQDPIINKFGWLIYMATILNAFLHSLIANADVKFQLPLVFLLILIGIIKLYSHLNNTYVISRKSS
ncbi:MAG: hypothetical protein CMP59_09055 [Flavobacteriales bacterium]|nr:hypothetical protein [Flavobacteriales bacterium]